MDQDLFNLQDHLAVMRRRWRLLALCLVIGVAVSLSLALRETPMYRGSARLLLQPQVDTTGQSGVVMSAEEVATQADVIASVQVADRVAELPGINTSADTLLDQVSVAVEDNKRVVTISALERTAAQASNVANAFAEQYIKYRSEVALDAAASTRNSYIQQLVDVRAQLNDVRLAIQKAGPGPLPTLEAREQSLVAREAELSTQLLTLDTPGQMPQSAGEVLLRAQPNDRPATPKPLRAGALGAILGLLVGVGAAYIRDRLDDAIRDEGRLRTALGGRPILGQLPGSAEADRGRVATLLQPRSPLSEAYRALNTNVRFLLAAGRDRLAKRGEVLLITSAGPGEGKTSVATNLAVTAARVGLKVILVDGDLRRPQVADRFGLDIPVGLSDVLAEGTSVQAHLHPVGIDNLRILAAGSIPPNPAELLASPMTAGVIDELSRSADMVIVDSAPVLRVADSLELVRTVDLIILVARHRVSRLHSVHAAAERVRQVGGSVAGGVFNDVDSKGSGYGYGYQPEEDIKPSRWQRRRPEAELPESRFVEAGPRSR